MLQLSVAIAFFALVAVKLCMTDVQNSSFSTTGGEELLFGYIDINQLITNLPTFLKQPANSENGTASKFKDKILDEHSNDEIATSSTEKIIWRSNFRAQTYSTKSKDGYITELIRISKPDVYSIKYPPIIMIHGGLTDPTMFVWGSAKQHTPTSHRDKLITSSNRSLAFFLVNNNYDVWLVGIRGCNKENQRTSDRNMTAQTKLDEYSEYWDFSMDEIIEQDLPNYINIVQRTANYHENVTLISISMSTQMTLAMLASNEKLARKVHNYICIAPILNNIGSNLLIRILNLFAYYAPIENGVQHLTNLFLSDTTRQALLNKTSARSSRYHAIHALTTAIFGPSPKYQTFLEDPVVGHLLQPMSFKQIKHWSQQVLARRLQKFDYGPVENGRIYGQPNPPIYDISNIHVKNWMVMSGTNDMLATPASVKQLLDTVNPKPLENIVIEGYNHLDLVAAYDVDVRVNLPILEFLEKQFVLKWHPSL